MSGPGRDELVRHYFIKTPPRPRYTAPLIAWCAGTAATLLATWLIWRQGLDHPGAAAVSALLTLAGVFGLTLGAVQGTVRWRTHRRDWARSQPKPTGRQMDDWRQQGIEDAIATGMRRLDLHIVDADRQHDILVFPGLPANLPYAAVGEDDNILRFPMYDILVVYLTAWRVSTYECHLDLHTGALVSDRTREFHLQQVDGIETQSDRIELKLHSRPLDAARDEPAHGGPGIDTFQITTQQRLQLLVSGRVAIALTIGLTVDDAWHASGLTRPAMDRLIARLREHLRRHMGGTHAADPRIGGADPKVIHVGPIAPAGGLPGE